MKPNYNSYSYSWEDTKGNVSYYDENDKLHRFYPNIFDWDNMWAVKKPKTCGILYEWWHHGTKIMEVFHGNSGLQVVRYFDTNGKLHSFQDEPAIIKFRKGFKWTEHWVKHGIPYRMNDKPTDIVYRDDGSVRNKKWIFRENERANIVFFNKEGRIVQEKWGKTIIGKGFITHRAGELPAVIFRMKNGSIQKEEWWIDGEKIETKRYPKNKISVSKEVNVFLQADRSTTNDKSFINLQEATNFYRSHFQDLSKVECYMLGLKANIKF